MWILGMMGCPTPTATEVLSTERTNCDPLDEGHCLYPFPSMHHLAEDSSTETGFRVDYRQGDFLTKRDGTAMDPEAWNHKDGYSINSTLLFFFDGGTDEGLVRIDAIERHSEPNAQTVLVDTVTGERVPHWVDLDATAVNQEQRAYTLHPAVPLHYDRTYVVGVRGIQTASGDAAPTEAFRLLRDGEVTDQGDLEYRVQHFDDVVFPKLEAAGASRGDLQLAWSFHTVSRTSSLGDMLHIRDEGLLHTPTVTVVSSEDHDCSGGENIGRTVELESSAPLYTIADGPGNILNRDADHTPLQNGETTFGITVRIPCAILHGATAAPVMQYGHGLLGSRGEVRTGWLSGMLQREGWVGAATDWTGMAEEDVTSIVTMAASETDNFRLIPERSMQGMLQQLLVIPALREAQDDPALAGLLDLDQLGYYGNSQGAIMGAAFMGLTQEIDRGVFGVSGVNYGLTLPRSKDFDLYYVIIRDGFRDGREISLLVQGLFQQLWDVSEGAGYLRVLNEDPLPNTPPKQVLVHTGIGDNQVTTLGAQIQARAYGAQLIEPAYRDVFGLEEVPAGFTGSALVEFHYSDAAEEGLENVPPEGPDPHECPRRELPAQVQIDTFLRTGVVDAPCLGAVCSGTVHETCP